MYFYLNLKASTSLYWGARVSIYVQTALNSKTFISTWTHKLTSLTSFKWLYHPGNYIYCFAHKLCTFVLCNCIPGETGNDTCCIFGILLSFASMIYTDVENIGNVKRHLKYLKSYNVNNAMVNIFSSIKQ